MSINTTKKCLGSLALLSTSLMATAQAQPNVILIYIDDMGYSDLSCYGGNYVPTPNIDKLADEGIRFTQYYSAAPISSPSRVGVTTGMYPTRWGINTFLQTRSGNAESNQNDFLDNRAPSMARLLKENGYTTGHFGKWHMGGGRDVYNAPSITSYGFDEYSSTWESPDPDPELTAGNWIWQPADNVKRWNRTAYFVDKTLDFLARNTDKPCFVNLWPDDVHTPWVYENDETTQRESPESFSIVLAELDVQIGRLMQGIKDLGIDDNTLVIFTSDNGPAPAFGGNRTDELRGQKATLYEGGIRMPFLIRWPAEIAPGQINTSSVVCSVDLLPSLCAITNTPVSVDFEIDGEDMSQALLGSDNSDRSTPLFWEFGKYRTDRMSPHIAVREGKWKLLVNADGSSVELYDMENDFLERYNLASTQKSVVNRLKPMALEWFHNAHREFADHVIHVSVNGDANKDGSSWEEATTIEHAVVLSANQTGAQIWLQAGTYELSSTLNFDDIQIYGGFVGIEQRLNDRDWKQNQTILDGKNQFSPLRNNDLARVVTSVLDGVIVQNGINQSGANGSENGGAMILASGAQIRNCIFRNNRTQNSKNGAAIHCHTGTITIENSLFVNNTSSGNGGAVQIGGGTRANVINCTFSNNKSARPGGAFGLGNPTSSELILLNSVAYNNLYGNVYNSYGQNDNINAGVVTSRHSAVESTSTKFTDGDDVNHITLTRELSPNFTSPASVIGYTSVPSEFSEIESASYELSENSLCIDAGNANYISDLYFDLNGNIRISGSQIDIGAYEFDKGPPIEDFNIIRVAVDGNANSDGSSWETVTTLGNALSLAGSYLNESEIWLKAGTYELSSTINFDDIQIYGGFAGTEQSFNERNWNQNQTILDGKNQFSPLRNNQLEKVVTSVLDGVIVQNGVNQSNANGNGNGGAMILASGAQIRNCIFRNNRTQGAKNGAAIHCHLGTITIENSLFVNNTSSGNGGAVQVGGGTHAYVINCTFSNNQSVRPGGAFGLGNNSSNLTLINSVAYGNLYGSAYNSFGQNDDIHGGGTVISKHSAVESTSTKFTDGDDVNHITLTRELSPKFVSPASVIGYTTVPSEFSEIEVASYQLSASSPCIDAGDNSHVTYLSMDLAGNLRISGSQVDIGAYEYDIASAVCTYPTAQQRRVQLVDGRILIKQAKKDDFLAMYNLQGSTVYSKVLEMENDSFEWTHKGLYILRVADETFKLLVQ